MMFKNAKPIQNDKLHDRVYDQLCTLLREGEFTPGHDCRPQYDPWRHLRRDIPFRHYDDLGDIAADIPSLA